MNERTQFMDTNICDISLIDIVILCSVNITSLKLNSILHSTLMSKYLIITVVHNLCCAFYTPTLTKFAKFSYQRCRFVFVQTSSNAFHVLILRYTNGFIANNSKLWNCLLLCTCLVLRHQTHVN
jgi:hypothetical protein